MPIVARPERRCQCGIGQLTTLIASFGGLRFGCGVVYNEATSKRMLSNQLLLLSDGSPSLYRKIKRMLTMQLLLHDLPNDGRQLSQNLKEVSNSISCGTNPFVVMKFDRTTMMLSLRAERIRERVSVGGDSFPNSDSWQPE